MSSVLGAKQMLDGKWNSHQSRSRENRLLKLSKTRRSQRHKRSPGSACNVLRNHQNFNATRRVGVATGWTNELGFDGFRTRSLYQANLPDVLSIPLTGVCGVSISSPRPSMTRSVLGGFCGGCSLASAAVPVRAAMQTIAASKDFMLLPFLFYFSCR